MEVFWAIFLTVVLVLVIAGIVRSSRDRKKSARIADRYLKEVDDYVRAGERYTVVLADGRRFESAQIVGYSQFHDGVLAGGQFPIGRWLVLQMPDGRRIFLRPQAIRYFEASPPHA